MVQPSEVQFTRGSVVTEPKNVEIEILDQCTVKQDIFGRNLFPYDFVHGLFCAKINSVLKIVHVKLCTLYMRTGCENLHLACSTVRK